MIELILGGARSGKSQLAEELAIKKQKSLIYLATAEVGDGEMADRILIHQSRRQSQLEGRDQWRLVEEPIYIGKALDKHQKEDCCVLVDCLTLWMTNLLMIEDRATLEEEKKSLLNALENIDGDVIFVSNEVGLGVVPLGEVTRQFVDEVGWLHQALAKKCDRVIFTVAGIPQVLKGEPLCCSG